MGPTLSIREVRRLDLSAGSPYMLLTTVMVSIHRTIGSEVKYRESDSEYSFHNCPNKSWAGAICVWLMTKYPSKKQWRDPAGKWSVAYVILFFFFFQVQK